MLSILLTVSGKIIYAMFHKDFKKVATESTCPIWTGRSVVEQMPAKGMVVSSSLTRSVGFPTAWPLCRQRRKLNTYFQEILVLITKQIRPLRYIEFTREFLDYKPG